MAGSSLWPMLPMERGRLMMSMMKKYYVCITNFIFQGHAHILSSGVPRFEVTYIIIVLINVLNNF